jgi:hypothetical protein
MNSSGPPRSGAPSTIAMSARSLALGCGLIAQSPYTTTSSGQAHEEHRRDQATAGLVPRIWSAGRTVAAVVSTAPANEPVDLPLLNHHGTDHDRSVR